MKRLIKLISFQNFESKNTTKYCGEIHISDYELKADKYNL